MAAPRALEDSNYGLGVIKEIPPWLLPQGALADALNMIFDEPGIARQRNGSTALSSPTTTAFSTAIGWCYSQDSGNTIEVLYGVNGKTPSVSTINPTTGANTLIGALAGNAGIYGRPVRHLGYVVFPKNSGPGLSRDPLVLAGAVANLSTSNTAVWNVVANSPVVTMTGADTTANVRVGQAFQASPAGFLTSYYGRVTAVLTGTTFRVSPTPTVTIAAAFPGGAGCAFAFQSNGGGNCVTSFQNRLIYGNTSDRDGAPGGGGAADVLIDRRCYYSPLPGETGFGQTVGGINATIYGAHWTSLHLWQSLNWFEAPGSDPIVALEPVSDNELLILTSQGAVILRGTLATQSATSAPGVTFDISPLNTNAGCLQDLAVVRTPHGVIWPSTEGIMLYTGGGRTPIDLTAGKIHTYWRNLTRGSSFAVHGGFYARNHYVVNGISGGATFCLCFNMDNQTWAIFDGTNAGCDTFNGVARPSDPTQVFVPRWWSQSGAAPSQTGGHVIRVDSMFAPDVFGQTKQDADGTNPSITATTRTLTGDQDIPRFARRLDVRYELEAFPAAASFAATTEVGGHLDSGDTQGTPTVNVGNLSNTSVKTITGQSNATPIVITTSGNHGLQSGDEVDIRGCTPNTAANGHWQILVINNTTFSLNGSKGNGATSGTGTCKKVTEQELDCSAADMGQGHWVRISTQGQVNRFKLHGVRLNVMMFPRGMGMK